MALPVEVDQARVRGLLLGAALGDAAGVVRGRWPAAGPLRIGVATQLTAFTVEGTIRGSVRRNHRGICHEPSVIGSAYGRWAVLQGVRPATRTDGWLAQVPALRERRGSAPATVDALTGPEPRPGVPAAVRPSRGAHALTRGLPLGLLWLLRGQGEWAEKVVRDTAALTHGAPDAQEAALAAAELVGHCLVTPDPFRTWATAPAGPEHPLHGLLQRLPLPNGASPTDVLALLRDPAAPALLPELAPDATAVSALLGALLVVTRRPGRDTVEAALRHAATAPDGSSVATTAGALLGAAHGVDALPVPLLSRLELVWELDTLARDLLQELTDSPAGSEYIPGRDPHWWSRYPGG
ncbi:ADP-ribosylglycohydrolase family protein [Kitasatospora sp. NPDC088134]|uniref:ADP-ribosylglycohydrolase family protein n=1 Tax=Kitasatospora sp. NPDC088134 TaxID=3364071 RepID=UPI0038175E4A